MFPPTSYPLPNPQPLPERRNQKALALTYLSENRVEEALGILVKILRENPEDPDAYMAMGECYLKQGEFENAVLLFTQALSHSPHNPAILARRAEAVARLGDEPRSKPSRPAESSPAPAGQAPQPEPGASMASMLQDLAPVEAQVADEVLRRASELMENIMNSSRPAQAMAEHLEEIDALLPGLLELNIRQARSERRPELAQSLQAMLDGLQKANRPAEAPRPIKISAPAKAQRPLRRVWCVGLSGEPASPRQEMTAQALSRMSFEVTSAASFPTDFLSQCDAVIAHNPHGDPRLLQGLAACAAAGIPVVVDLDADFEQMPVTHPHYARLGLGTPENVKAFTTALLLADAITVPNDTLAAGLRQRGYPARVIADGWDRRNPLWDKPNRRRNTIHLGWSGTAGQLNDLIHVRRMVLRVMHEFPQVNLMVVGDAQVYQTFDHLPETRRLFVPAVRAEDFPYLLGQLDILLVPLRNTGFNRCESDLLLVQAGIRRIPWVGSPIPSFMSWEAGGLIVHSPDEWHTHLRQLVMDADLRASLGQAGRRKAEEREINLIAPAWSDLILECGRQKRGEPPRPMRDTLL